ncbi:MAG TPA: MmcQ/YjbR family DNA-binding protein [Polyangiaceae bacterium]|nr:MmcQ/YjbR family DNA-binding protein [Polyangiaceae bacterium]
MVTPVQAKRLALALPETEEKSHFGQPDFRVRNKIFGGLSRDLVTASVKLPSARQAELVESQPEVFSAATGAWGRSGWTIVQLDGVEADVLKELFTLSWQAIAPRSLVEAQPSAAVNTHPRRVPTARTKSSPKAQTTPRKQAGKKRPKRVSRVSKE